MKILYVSRIEMLLQNLFQPILHYKLLPCEGDVPKCNLVPELFRMIRVDAILGQGILSLIWQQINLRILISCKTLSYKHIFQLVFLGFYIPIICSNWYFNCPKNSVSKIALIFDCYSYLRIYKFLALSLTIFSHSNFAKDIKDE